MIGKLAGALVALAFATPAVPQGIPYYAPIELVTCTQGKGTAFRVEGGRMVSAAHVTSNSNCQIDDQPFPATAEPNLDFSVGDGEWKGRGFKINCGGFVPGQWYFAIGHASGRPWQTMVMILATYRVAENGTRILFGSPSVIPGMSGGPILNPDGEVVGIVNAYVRGMPFSFSRELKDTSLCEAGHA